MALERYADAVCDVCGKRERAVEKENGTSLYAISGERVTFHPPDGWKQITLRRIINDNQPADIYKLVCPDHLVQATSQLEPPTVFI